MSQPPSTPVRPMLTPQRFAMIQNMQRSMQMRPAGSPMNPLFRPIQAMTPQPMQMMSPQVMTPQNIQMMQQMMMQQRIAAMGLQRPLSPATAQKPQPTPKPPVRPPQIKAATPKIRGPVSSLLPPVNTYAPRLKKGETSLVTVLPKEETATRKRGRFTEESSDEDEFDDRTDSEQGSDEEGRSKPTTPAPSASESKPADPPILTKRKRMLRTTKHEYEKLYIKLN